MSTSRHSQQPSSSVARSSAAADSRMGASRIGGESMMAGSRASRVVADGKRRANQQASQLDVPYTIKDPEDKTEDRTPKPLLKAEHHGRAPARGAAAAGSSDRRVSVQTGEGGSVSIRTSRSEERSVSHAEGSSSSSEHISTSTPDDYTTDLYDDSTSESISTMERSSVSGPGRRQSQVSSSEGASHMGVHDRDAGGEGKRGQAGGADSGAPPAREKLTSTEPRLHVLEKHLGRKAPPRYGDHQGYSEWASQDVVITLEETPVMFIFEKRDEVVANAQTAEADAVRKANQRYDDFLVSKKENEAGGKYISRASLTLNEPMFVFRHDAPQIAAANGHAQVSEYDLYDQMLLRQQQEDEEAEAGNDDAKETAAARDDGDEGGEGHGDEEGGGGEDEDGGAGDGGDGGEGGGSSPKRKRGAAWMSSPSLLETLLIVERCIVQNNAEDLQLAYRGLAMEPLKDHIPAADLNKPTSPTEGNRRRREHVMPQSDERDAIEEQRKKDEQREKQRDGAASPERSAQAKAAVLWNFGCESTRGKNVTCLAWNRRNPDLLAAGYGEYGVPGVEDAGTGNAYSGIVNCWSLKNPYTPERSIKIESEAGVSALHFSRQYPSLLAVGNTDGTLALYDVRVHGNSPALKTTVGTGQHTGTIWEVRWVDKGQDRGETLISISADGLVMEWSIKKGLEKTAILMRLKRSPVASESHGAGLPGKSGAVKEATLARQSGGMCFDMHPREPITYVVGTEDGTLHKCTKSQNENYVQTYKPHGEPVYRVRWNPFCPDYFVSASADWTSRLYHVDKPDPLITYDSNAQCAVQDFAWSHSNSTVFATASAKGHVDLWDVGSASQRLASLPLGRQLNCLAFAEQDSPVLTCGDVNGDVSVVKLYGEEFERGGRSNEAQEAKVREAVHKVSAP